MVETRKYFTEFWPEFFLYFTLPPDSKAWISAYVARSKSRVGVYLTFERGALATKLYSGLLAQRPEIEKALGIQVDWEDEGGDKYYVLTRKSFADVSDSRYRAEIIRWLRDNSNRFVTVFRPRIEALLRDSAN